MKIINSILASFENNNNGYSGRKLTAFGLMCLIVFIHYKQLNADNATEFLIIDLCGVFLSLGLVTFGQIIELKNGQANKTDNIKSE